MTDEVKEAPQYMDYAGRALRTARLAFDDGDWVGAINRAYYAIFYAANAALELNGIESSRLSTVRPLFQRKYVKTGKVEAEFGEIFGETTELHSKSETIQFPSWRDAVKAIEGARRFVERMQKLAGEN